MFKTKSSANSKVKVLSLQQLGQTRGGGTLGGASPNAWSTLSGGCGTVGGDEWSTLSGSCQKA